MKKFNPLDHTLHIYTDGSCLKNPGGAGGVAFIYVVNNTIIKEYNYGYKSTTNNRMELLSAVESLQLLYNKTPLNIIIYSDSKYVVDGFNKYIFYWKTHNWIKKDKKPVKNIDIWSRIVPLADFHNSVTFQWVKGHQSNPFNNRCDYLAQQATTNKKLLDDINISNNYHQKVYLSKNLNSL